jgi:hypothetical protein
MCRPSSENKFTTSGNGSDPYTQYAVLLNPVVKYYRPEQYYKTKGHAGQ